MKFLCYFEIFILFVFFKINAQTNAGGWKYVGPKEMNTQVKGFIKSVWVDDKNLNFVLAGSCSGGLFKTINATAEKPLWQCISDSYVGMSFGVADIVVKPGTQNNTIFIATGHNSALPMGYGNGILKTVNGGISWQEVGPKAVRQNLFMMEGLVMNPQNSSEMIAYTSKQIFITRNEWASFEEIKIPFEKDKDISFCDVEFAPFETGKFYVCTRTNNFYDPKLYVCENFGKSITDITPKGIKSERIEVAVINKEAFKNKFYVALGVTDVFVQFFNGINFSTLNTLPVNHTYSGTYWNLELSVNELDTSVIYICMTEISRSVNGGKSFEKIGVYNGENTHADVRAAKLVQHSIKGVKDVFITGNDGGVSFINQYNPPQWKNLNGTGLNVNQFWGIDVAQSDTMFASGGAQDNGGFLISENSSTNTINSCGDGYLGLVLDEVSSIIECNAPSIYYHNIKLGLHNYLSIPDNKYETKRPLLIKDSFVYVGYHDVWRINKYRLQKGETLLERFTAMPDVKDENGNLRNNSIKCMSFGNLNTGVIVYANQNWGSKENAGKMFFSPDLKAGAKEWIDITSLINYNTLEVFRWMEVCDVELDLSDGMKFNLIAKNPFDQTDCLLLQVTYVPDSAKCIFKKLNGYLPAIGLNKIKRDKFSTITYLAADDGVYFAELTSDSAVWNKMNAVEHALPGVMVTGLSFNYYANKLVAATYGRGIWQTELLSNLNSRKEIRVNTTENQAVKIDGKLVVERKRTYTINSKFIITKGSVIDLKKGSTLYIKDKHLVRDGKNEIINIETFIRKSKGAQVLYK
ncbi:MAG: hypothetical protein HYX39_10360 [Bacteroidetes bacterium]|nr:hypothetical protein [Bacteroidota bacterium]